MLSINAAISAAVVLASRLHDDLAVFALMLFSVEAFALFPIFRRRIQVSPVLTGVMPVFTQTRNAVDASTRPIHCYAFTRVGGTGSTVTYALWGRFDERDIWSTSCFDVGTAVQVVSLSSSSWRQRLLRMFISARFAVLGTQRLRVELSG